FMTKVYNVATTYPMSSVLYYNQVMSELDRESFIDWMIMNSYMVNSDLWTNNIAFAKGGDAGRPGYTWHYYLWNMPTILTFTDVPNNYTPYPSITVSPCLFNKGPYPSPSAQ